MSDALDANLGKAADQVIVWKTLAFFNIAKHDRIDGAFQYLVRKAPNGISAPHQNAGFIEDIFDPF